MYSDVERISLQLQTSVEAFVKAYCVLIRLTITSVASDAAFSVVRIALKKRGNDECVFLTSANLCSIHEVKPSFCREFPFVGAPDKITAEFSYCEGFGRGPLYGDDELAVRTDVHRRLLNEDHDRSYSRVTDLLANAKQSGIDVCDETMDLDDVIVL